MARRAISFADSETPERAISFVAQCSVSKLRHLADGWMLDCEIEQHSEATLTNRRYLLEKLFWFFEEKKIDCCNPTTLRQFLLHVTTPNEIGRWGENEKSRTPVKKVKSGTVATYQRILKAFFNWIVEQDGLEASPMAKIANPVDRPDQIAPFTSEQVQALLAAGRKTSTPRRDEAMLLLFLDTGMRVSELCGLCMDHVDMTGRKARVMGKGGKERTVPFGRKTCRALWQYLREHEREDDSPIFLAEAGRKTGEALSRSGVEQKIRKLGITAHIEQTRCSPHTFRHTFAIEFLRAGGNQFTLMEILGHVDVKMTARYVSIAKADVEKQHRQFSPVDKMKK
jgi:integrase/recombinase XerC